MREFIRWVKSELAWIRQRIEKIDIIQRITPGGADAFLIVVDQGNTLETGQDGINWYDGVLTEVPSAYDPDVTSTFIDGIGRGILYRNGVPQDGYVLVVNDNRGSVRNALFQNDPFRTSGAVAIDVAGGGSVRAWTVGT